VQKNQIFQKKRWMTLITKVFALILGITLMLPTFCATADPSPIDGTWKIVSPPEYIPFEIAFRYDSYEGHDYGKMACNSYDGTYVIELDPDEHYSFYSHDYYQSGEIGFDPQKSTKVSCAENRLESRYLQELQLVRDYKISNDRQLTLSSRYAEPLEYVKISD